MRFPARIHGDALVPATQDDRDFVNTNRGHHGGNVMISVSTARNVRSEGYVHRVGSLPEKHRAQVRTAGQARLAELKKREAEQVAA